MRTEGFILWVTPRPAYMREIEPLAVPGAWDGPFYPDKYRPILKPEKLKASA